jgi:hypothetical protein
MAMPPNFDWRHGLCDADHDAALTGICVLHVEVRFPPVIQNDSRITRQAAASVAKEMELHVNTRRPIALSWRLSVIA